MASSRTKVLIVDDEPQFLRFLKTGLRSQGYHCIEAVNGTQAIAMAAREKPDAIVLDLGLPDRDGFWVIRELRNITLTPIVVISAREDVEGNVKALGLGADDYVTKPFDMSEFLARLRAAQRHSLQAAGGVSLFRSGPLSMDLLDRRVVLNGDEVHLSPKQYSLLHFLVIHAGKVVTHQQLLKEVWGPTNVGNIQYVHGLTRQLRRKLEPQSTSVQLLMTEHGVGYRLLVLPSE